MNRTLVEVVRSMLTGAHLPPQFWAEALATAVYPLRNRSLTKSLKNLTPFEAWTGRKPSVNHLKVFGCIAYGHIAKEERKKLDVKAKKCILLGYGVRVKGYRLYDLQKRKVFYSRDVVFDEDSCIESENKEQPESNDCKLNTPRSVALMMCIKMKYLIMSNHKIMKNLTLKYKYDALPETEDHQFDVVSGSYVQDSQSPEPVTVEEALDGSEKNKWKEAMKQTGWKDTRK